MLNCLFLLKGILSLGYLGLFLQNYKIMSATFKNAKKKLSQPELRKIMNDHKSKPKDVKKIDSPLAKYNEQGQLICVLCQSVVRSEAVWTVHINAKQHKQNVEMAKKLKERTNNFTKPLKRPLTPPLPERPDKKIKGILKNGTSNTTEGKSPTNPATNGNDKTLPDDFFDSKMKNGIPPSKKNEDKETETEGVQEAEDALPEGFFDDPKLDAKARNQEYKDPVEEEWERFLKAIKDADNESNAIMAEDQEESTTERQIDEIDEQMKKLSRVLDLEKKKEEIVAASSEPKQSSTSEDNEDENLDDFDEFLDWRDKKSFQ
ncbi:unnamed protein product [Phaedon cochleariae]|uniref:Zinc finger protein 830 n=1 Tax=Phaedon cochleariae TaxID=80249 RepID=A0A9N9X502_PHACE|nr:unnamed protein product [Phaedon cochleariae]